ESISSILAPDSSVDGNHLRRLQRFDVGRTYFAHYCSPSPLVLPHHIADHPGSDGIFPPQSSPCFGIRGARDAVLSRLCPHRLSVAPRVVCWNRPFVVRGLCRQR